MIMIEVFLDMNTDTEVLVVIGSPVGLKLASDLAGCSEPR